MMQSRVIPCAVLLTLALGQRSVWAQMSVSPEQLQPRSNRFKATLTLGSLAELWIQEGAEVKAGQVIAERAADPVLLTQIAELEAELETLTQDPPDFFAGYHVQETELLQIREQYIKQLELVRKVEAVPVSPQTKRQQREVLDQLRREFELLQIQAQATHAEALRQQTQHQQDRLRERQRLQAEIQLLQQQLEEARTITAAVDGQVERIKIVGQTNQEIEVEVTFR